VQVINSTEVQFIGKIRQYLDIKSVLLHVGAMCVTD